MQGVSFNEMLIGVVVSHLSHICTQYSPHSECRACRMYVQARRFSVSEVRSSDGLYWFDAGEIRGVDIALRFQLSTLEQLPAIDERQGVHDAGA